MHGHVDPHGPTWIHTDTCGRCGYMEASAPGSGVIAGSSIRTVLELAGIKNILSKQLGSNNLLNNARATINGLSLLRSYNN